MREQSKQLRRQPSLRFLFAKLDGSPYLAVTFRENMEGQESVDHSEFKTENIDEYADEDSGEEDFQVELGYLDEIESSGSLLHLNPNWKKWDGGKVGGRPVWLNPRDLPEISELCCKFCGKTMPFLLQV